MDVVFFVTVETFPPRKKLVKQIASVADGVSVEVVSHTDTLVKRLRRLPRRMDVAVLHVADGGLLSEVISFKELLEDIRIILVLPDRDKKTVSRGHLLRPRFLTFADAGYEQVTAVLAKMADNVMKRNGTTRRG